MNSIMIYLIIALLVIGCGLMLIAFTYPEYYARFGKFLFRRIRRTAGRPALKPEEEEAKAKTKNT